MTPFIATRPSNRTQQRLDQLRDLQARSYEDKLHGTITEQAWREHHERWQREAEALEAQIATKESLVSREEFLRIVRTPLELAQHAASQYVAQNEAEKARLLKILCSNYRVDAGTITVQMRSSFDALLRQRKVAIGWEAGIRTPIRAAPIGQLYCLWKRLTNPRNRGSLGS